MEPASSRARAAALTSILVLGAGLRFVPIWFGLPYVTARPDEETSLGHAAAILGGDPNPHFFHWPSLTFYVFAGLFEAASAAKRLAGMTADLTDAQRLLIARGCVALAGTATILVLFRVGRRVGGDAVGLIAALFLAVSMLHVRESHFAMTDALMTFFAMTSLALMLRGFDGGGARSFMAAGLAGGLAASTKYTAVALLASLAVAHVLLLLRSTEDRLRTWAASGAFVAFFAFGFIAATPYAALDSRKFVEDFQFNVTHLSEGHAVNLGRGWVYHLVRSLPYGVSWPIFLTAITGVVPFVRRHRDYALIVGAFAVATYVSLGNGYTVFFRYVLPIVPIVCLSAAVAIRQAASAIRSVHLQVDRTALWLASIVALSGAVNCVWFDALLARKDTRVLAREWLDAQTMPSDTLYEAETGYSMLDLRGLSVHSWQYDPASDSFLNAGGRTPDWLVLHQSPLSGYAADPPPLRRLAAERYDLAQTIAATKGAARSAIYDPQDAFFMPVSGFSTVIRAGPTILIYKRRH